MNSPIERLKKLVEEATPRPWTLEDGREDILPYLTIFPVGQPDDGCEDRESVLGSPIHVAHVISLRDQPLIALAPALGEAAVLAELVETVIDVWEPLTGVCDDDCECVVHELIPALAAFIAAISDPANGGE